LLCGADGEDLAIETASELSGHYALINQVDIPSCSISGFNEADLIILGPKCIFILEVKHNGGKILGREFDAKWHVERKSKNGVVFINDMRNPVQQVKNLVEILSVYLDKKSAPAWLQPIVLFTNDNVRLSLDKMDVPILTTEELNNYIEAYSYERCGDISKETLRAILQLKNPRRS